MLPRRAWFAPKLMRRVKGVVGAVRAWSSSSIAFSSVDSLVERLARRRNDEGVVGDVPDRPNVETESLRRVSKPVAVIGIGKPVTGGCEIELLLNRLLKAAEVTVESRLCCCRFMSLRLLLLLVDELSEDIVKRGDRRGGRGGWFISKNSGGR